MLVPSMNLKLVRAAKRFTIILSNQQLNLDSPTIESYNLTIESCNPIIKSHMWSVGMRGTRTNLGRDKRRTDKRRTDERRTDGRRIGTNVG